MSNDPRAGYQRPRPQRLYRATCPCPYCNAETGEPHAPDCGVTLPRGGYVG